MRLSTITSNAAVERSSEIRNEEQRLFRETLNDLHEAIAQLEDLEGQMGAKLAMSVDTQVSRASYTLNHTDEKSLSLSPVHTSFIYLVAPLVVSLIFEIKIIP